MAAKAKYIKEVAKAGRLRAKVVETYIKEELWNLKPLLRELEKTPMSKRLLQETGLHYLVSDQTLWTTCSTEAGNLRKKWDSILTKEVSEASTMMFGKVQELPQQSLPFGGKGAANFKTIQSRWTATLTVQAPHTDKGCRWHASVTLTNLVLQRSGHSVE